MRIFLNPLMELASIHETSFLFEGIKDLNVSSSLAVKCITKRAEKIEERNLAACPFLMTLKLRVIKQFLFCASRKI